MLRSRSTSRPEANLEGAPTFPVHGLLAFDLDQNYTRVALQMLPVDQLGLPSTEMGPLQFPPDTLRRPSTQARDTPHHSARCLGRPSEVTWMSIIGYGAIAAEAHGGYLRCRCCVPRG